MVLNGKYLPPASAALCKCTPLVKEITDVDIPPSDLDWDRPSFADFLLAVREQANEWRASKQDRDPSGRFTYNAKRVALISACANKDKVVTKAGMNCALSLMRWQEKIRERFQPGEALNQDAECTSKILEILSRPGMNNIKWSTLTRNSNLNKQFASAMSNRCLRGLVESNQVIASH
jgi:hypothetical protein